MIILNNTANRSTSRSGRRASLLVLLLVVVQLVWAPVATADGWHDYRHSNSQHRSQGANSVLTPLRHAQKANDSKRQNFRSRSEVVAEVKRRYDARVLKISLNRKREIYNVRILMPNGKVRNLQVSARR
ncbi:MAG: hypothetical protein HKN50_12175 [Gammaproteobacteria bacterium]|nr:hypothetical protein [Gammaproteobacteria bacterium]